MAILKPFILAILGTSLSTGRLSADWVPRFLAALKQQPEAIGPLEVYNMGKGSQTSDWGVTQAPNIAALRPSHVLMEGFAINDSVVTGGVPAVTQPNHIANIVSIVGIIRAARADADITIQTMNPVASSGAALRPNLAAYYADEITTAAANSCRSLDNYGGVSTGIAGGWPKPLPTNLTYDSDGLHPIWVSAVEVYLFPNVLFWARQRMAEYWGLPAPTPPPKPGTPLIVEYEIVAGGGGGGGLYGGGGGAGGVVRGSALINDFIPRSLIVGPGGPPRTKGSDSSFSEVVASGGGYGGLFGINNPLERGGRGGSGGGGGVDNNGPSIPGGAGETGQGALGGSSVHPYGGGGGGGRAGQGQDANSGRAGDGGGGVISSAPGSTQRIAPGGPASGLESPPGIYQLGFARNNPGAGGPSGTSDDSGWSGQISLWYLGPPRATGGAISSFGGYTIHTFFGDGDFQVTS